MLSGFKHERFKKSCEFEFGVYPHAKKKSHQISVGHQ